MEYAFMTGISLLSYIVYYLYKELKKSKSLHKQVLEQIEQSKKVKRDDSIEDPAMIIRRGALDEIRRMKFEEERDRSIKEREMKDQRDRILRDFYTDKQKEVKKWDRYGSENQCPPKSGSCPLSHCIIPAGTSIRCSGCGRDIQSNAPMFDTKNDSNIISTSTTTDIVIDNSNFPSGTTTDFTSIFDNSGYKSSSTNDNEISFGGGDFGGSGAGSSYDDNSSSSDYSSDSGSDYSSSND